MEQRRTPYRVMAILFSLLLASMAGAAPQAETLEELVRQWVALNGEAAAEIRSWEQQQAWMETRISLLEQEQDRLQARVTAERAQRGDGEDARLALSERVGESSTELLNVDAALDLAAERARAWLPLIPEPLRGAVVAAHDGMIRTGAGSAEAGAASRLQAVVAFYAALEDIQGSIHAVQQLIRIEGGVTREMDVLYLGLAQAYAVSADGSVAALGHPAAGGWVWSSAPDAAEQIRRALRTYRKETPASLLALPVQVTATAKGGAK